MKKTYTVIFIRGDRTDEPVTRVVQAADEHEAWDRAQNREGPGETWLVGLFEGKLKNLINRID